MGDVEGHLIYDGDCPFCARYVKLLRLRDALGGVRLIDARDGGPETMAVVEQGYRIDDGMALVLDGEVYHGADCMHRLALMTTRSSTFNRLNAKVFRSPTLSRALYPFLRGCRNGALRVLGRERLEF